MKKKLIELEDDLFEKITNESKKNKRSVNSEIAFAIEFYLKKK